MFSPPGEPTYLFLRWKEIVKKKKEPGSENNGIGFGRKKITVEVNVVPHSDGGAPDLNGPLHGFKAG